MSLARPIKIGDTTIQILLEADQAYPVMLTAIGRAKRSILLTNYCMVQGEAFERFSTALGEAARRGVQVRVVLDAYGSPQNDPRRMAALQAAGVELRWSRKLNLARIWRYNHGLHKKLLIIDNEQGFTGGIGIGDFWLGPTPGYPAAWRDTHFALTGPAVADMTAAFTHSWQANGGSRLQPTDPPNKPTPNPAIIPINSQPPGRARVAPIGTKLLRLIAATQRQLTITTAYFGPSRPVIQALQAAARRGVKIRILTNGPYCTHPSARDAGRHRYAPLLAAGTHIYEYQPTKIHTKAIISDRNTSVIGSANLNFRSLYHDEEFSFVVHSPELTAQLEAQFESDLLQATEIATHAWQRRPAGDKLRQAIASLARYIF